MSTGGGGTSTQTVQQQLSPEQQQLLSLVIPQAEEFIQNPPQLYPQPITQPFTPTQLAGQQAGIGAAGQIGGLAGFALPSTQDFLTQARDPLSNPFLLDLINASIQPVTDQLTQQILPSIRGEAILAGGFGGSRQGIAEGLATQGATRAAGDIAARIGSDAFTSGQEQFTKGLFALPGLADLALQPASILDIIGGQQQTQAEREIAELSQRFFQEQTLPFGAAQDVAGLAFGIPGGSATTTGAFDPARNPFGNALGGAAIGMMLGGPVGALIGGAGGLLAGIL